MNFVVIGTDHRMQHSDAGLEAILRSWTDRRFITPLTAIAEEYHKDLGSSIGQRIAKEKDLHWFNVDMTVEEKQKAGILQEQQNRPKMFQEKVCCRIPSDDVREDAWVKKLSESASGTALVICGYLHFEPLVQKLCAEGHIVDKCVYLETVPAIKCCDK